MVTLTLVSGKPFKRSLTLLRANPSIDLPSISWMISPTFSPAKSAGKSLYISEMIAKSPLFLINEPIPPYLPVVAKLKSSISDSGI